MAGVLPVEIEVENQKIVKIEVDLQSCLHKIENACITVEEFEELVVETRVMMSDLKNVFTKFQKCAIEWEDEILVSKELDALVLRHRLFLKSLQSNFHTTCVNGKKRLQQVEKDILLSTTQECESRLRQRKTNKAQVAKKASDITQNLLDIARLMDSQVRLGEDSNSVLEGSSQQVKDTHEEFKGLTGIISVSRKLLNKYNRRELTDTLLLFFGLVLFFATVVYIISKRI